MKERIACKKKEVAGIFEMRDLGEVHWFLAMEITCDQIAQTITIDQWQYIWKILECFGIENVWSVSTPMAANINLPKLEVPEVDQHLYQSMLRSLMYTVIGTCPDIMFAVHHLSQFLATPRLEHLVAMKCVYRCRRENGLMCILPMETSFGHWNMSLLLQDKNPIIGRIFAGNPNIRFFRCLPNRDVISSLNPPNSHDPNGGTYIQIGGLLKEK